MKKIFGIGAVVAGIALYSVVSMIENDVMPPAHGLLLGILAMMLFGICLSLSGACSRE